MIPIKIQKIHFNLCLLFILSWFLQLQFYMGWDISWGLHESKKLLTGGTYGKDFFEQSPPMFLYLYSPSILISSFFKLNLAILFKIYIYLLCGISLLLCDTINKKIFPQQDNPIRFLFLLALTTVFLFIPFGFDFGQREHIMLVLVMPYLLTVVLRLKNESLNLRFLIVIGCLSGLGFAIKPFFLIPFFFIELLLISFKQRFTIFF